MFFCSFCCLHDPANIVSLNLVPLPFLSPACISGSSWFTYCWSLAWRILITTLLHVKWMQLYSSLSIPWHCPPLGLEWKLTFSSPVCCWVFKFAGMLSVALSQHHLLGFEIAQLEFLHLQVTLFIVMLPKAHFTSHSRMSGSRWVITPSWLSWSLKSFLYSSSVYSCYLFLISSTSVRSIHKMIEDLGSNFASSTK